MHVFRTPQILRNFCAVTRSKRRRARGATWVCELKSDAPALFPFWDTHWHCSTAGLFSPGRRLESGSNRSCLRRRTRENQC
jgi:hypothetical protein